MAEYKDQRFFELLVKNNIVSAEKLSELRQAAAADKKSLENFLIEKQILSQEKITALKAEAAGMAYRDLRDFKVSSEALNAITFEVAQNYHIACFEKNGKKASIGLIDPYNSKAIEAINFLLLILDHPCKLYRIIQILLL